MCKIEIYNDDYSILRFKKEITTGGYTTFVISIKNGAFSGEHPFCMSNGDLKNLIDLLKKTYKKLSGEIRITDCESTSYVLFIVDKSSVTVEGEFGMCFGDDFLRFKMHLDQTVILLLYNAFNEFLNPAYYQAIDD